MDLAVLDWVSRLMTVETEIRILQVELGIQNFEQAAGRREPVHNQQSEFVQCLAVLQREQERIETRLSTLQANHSNRPMKLRSRDAGPILCV